MNKAAIPSVVFFLCVAGGALIGDSLAQTSTSPGIGDKIKPSTKTAKTPVSIQGIPAQFDLETRVEVLERRVAELQGQVDRLIERIHEGDTSLVGPSGRLTPLNTDEDKSGYSGPQLKVPAKRKGE